MNRHKKLPKIYLEYSSTEDITTTQLFRKNSLKYAIFHSFVLCFLFFLIASCKQSSYENGINDYQSLASTKILFCKFPISTYASPNKNGNFVAESSNGFGDQTVYFSDIDHKNNHAIFTGNSGKSEVVAMLTTSTLNFIEQTDSGNLMFTTIFPIKNDKNEFFATTSRTLVILNSIMVGQLYGFCKAG